MHKCFGFIHIKKYVSIDMYMMYRGFLQIAFFSNSAFFLTWRGSPAGDIGLMSDRFHFASVGPVGLVLALTGCEVRESGRVLP